MTFQQEQIKRLTKEAARALNKIEDAAVNLEIDAGCGAAELLILAIRKGIDGNNNFNRGKALQYFIEEIKEIR